MPLWTRYRPVSEAPPLPPPAGGRLGRWGRL